jgi:hypothetical protein
VPPTRRLPTTFTSGTSKAGGRRSPPSPGKSTSHGRGALLFTPSAEIGGEFDSIYMPLASFGGHPLLKEYSNLIESYDPTKQIVALFLTPPSCVSAYCGGLTPERLVPPEAYRKVRRVLNWN